VLFVTYLWLSAMQISYGFPIFRKGSSLLESENEIKWIGSQIFTNIPFVIEIRCLLDWCMMKTSLDLF